MRQQLATAITTTRASAFVVSGSGGGGSLGCRWPAIGSDRANRLVCSKARIERGALLRNLGDTMYLFPPLTTDQSAADRMVAIMLEAIDAVIPRS